MAPRQLLVSAVLLHHVLSSQDPTTIERHRGISPHAVKNQQAGKGDNEFVEELEEKKLKGGNKKYVQKNYGPRDVTANDGQACIKYEGKPAVCGYHGEDYLWCWTSPSSWALCKDDAPKIDKEDFAATDLFKGRETVGGVACKFPFWLGNEEYNDCLPVDQAVRKTYTHGIVPRKFETFCFTQEVLEAEGLSFADYKTKNHGVCKKIFEQEPNKLEENALADINMADYEVVKFPKFGYNHSPVFHLHGTCLDENPVKCDEDYEHKIPVVPGDDFFKDHVFPSTSGQDKTRKGKIEKAKAAYKGITDLYNGASAEVDYTGPSLTVKLNKHLSTLQHLNLMEMDRCVSKKEPEGTPIGTGEFDGARQVCPKTCGCGLPKRVWVENKQKWADKKKPTALDYDARPLLQEYQIFYRNKHNPSTNYFWQDEVTKVRSVIMPWVFSTGVEMLYYRSLNDKKLKEVVSACSFAQTEDECTGEGNDRKDECQWVDGMSCVLKKDERTLDGKKCADACKRPAGASYETKPQCHPIVPRKLASVANDNPVEQCAEGSVVRDIKANVKSCATKKEDGCKKSSACKWTDDKCESQFNSSIEFQSWDAAEKKAAKTNTPVFGKHLLKKAANGVELDK